MRLVTTRRSAAVTLMAVLSAWVLAPGNPVWAGEETPTEALRSLINSALAAARQGDQVKLDEIARSLGIPNPEEWFRATFGEEEGTKWAAAYARHVEPPQIGFPKLIQNLAKYQVEVAVEDEKESKSSTGNDCGQTLLKAAKNGTSFYRVSLQWVDSSAVEQSSGAGYFTFVEGAYRRLNCAWLGIFGPIRVGGKVQSARAIKKVPPAYPEKARENRISGTVRLHVIIAKDGTMKQVELLSGHPLLAPAAIEAVWQWTYQPTLLNGEPVEVDTTIDVVFTLNTRPAQQP